MLFLEIVSEQSNINVNETLEKWYFPALAMHRMQEQALNEIVDIELESSLTLAHWEQVKKVLMHDCNVVHSR